MQKRLTIALAVILLPAIYVAGYFALVKPPGKPGLLGRYGHYRFGEPIVPWIFYSLERLDRNARPEVWKLPRKE